MKKIYIIPEIQVEQAESVMPLAASGVTGNMGSNNIGYGGVDRDGILDPCTKENPFEFEYQW